MSLPKGTDAQTSNRSAAEPSATDDYGVEESLPRAIAAVLVVIAALAIMSAMLNQYIAIDAARQVQSWLHDAGSNSGFASTAKAATDAMQVAAKRNGSMSAIGEGSREDDRQP